MSVTADEERKRVAGPSTVMDRRSIFIPYTQLSGDSLFFQKTDQADVVFLSKTSSHPLVIESLKRPGDR